MTKRQKDKTQLKTKHKNDLPKWQFSTLTFSIQNPSSRTFLSVGVMAAVVFCFVLLFVWYLFCFLFFCTAVSRVTHPPLVPQTWDQQ